MRSFLWPFAIVGFGAILMMLLGTQVEVIDQDETIYALVALDLLAGKLPYEGVFDHKPLGVYYIYAAVLSILGDGFISIRIMSITLLCGAAANLFFGLRKLGYSANARYAAAITALAFPIGLSGLAGNTEIIQNFFLSLIFLVICCKPDEQSNVRRFSLLLAYGTAVAVGFSINYLFSFIALFSYIAYASISLFVTKRSIPSILVSSVAIFIGFGLGSAIIYSPYLIDFLSNGQKLQSYLTEQRDFLSSYQYPLNKQRILERLFVWIVPFLPILVAGTVARLQWNTKITVIQIFAAMTFVAACLAAVMSLSLFHHYWILACVPIALFAAVAIERTEDKGVQDILRYSLCGALALYLVFGSEKVVNHYLKNIDARQFHAAISYIDKNISEQDTVVSMQVSPAYAFTNKLNIQQKFVFPNHVPKLDNADLLDADSYYLELLDGGRDYVLAHPDTCNKNHANANKFAQSCAELESSYSEIASFQGYYPVNVYKYSLTGSPENSPSPTSPQPSSARD